jgi:AcrR family transcriptional regulator
MGGGRQGAADRIAPGLPRPAHDGLEREYPEGHERPDGHQHPIGHEQVSEIQRARILAAMVDVATELGARRATVARVVARSGVSRRTFYELFVDREACFLAAFDEAVERVAAVVVPAYEEPSKWRERVRAGLAALLEFLDYQHDWGRLVIVEALGAGPRALECRQGVLTQIIAVVDRGRKEARGTGDPPPLTAEGIVGGVLSLIHSRLLEDSDTPLVELLGPLMSMVVLPYLGPAAAHRELTLPGTGERPVPVAHNNGRKAGADPLRDLDMRLTYRTIRVLLAIGAGGPESDPRGSYPSNRQVADAAGIRDQGQISKLLARLQQLGLIRNASDPRAKGAPNAWVLTERGSEVHEVLSP